MQNVPYRMEGARRGLASPHRALREGAPRRSVGVKRGHAAGAPCGGGCGGVFVRLHCG